MRTSSGRQMKENRYRISSLQGSFPCKGYSVASCSTLIRLGVGIATENNGEALRESFGGRVKDISGARAASFFFQ